MNNSYRWKFVVIAVLVAGFLAAWAKFGLTLGIDLQGGSTLIYKLDFSKLRPSERTPATTESTIEILSKRLDTLQLKEMSIRRAGTDEILIQLPGMSEGTKDQIKKVIASSGNLWFKIVVEPREPDYSAELVKDIEEKKARGEYKAENWDFDTARDRENPEHVYLLRNEDAVDGKFLEGADAGRDKFMRPAVNFYMKPAGRARLAATTEKWQNHRMAIVLDGIVQSAPNINSPIPDGSGIIEGSFTQKEVDALVTVLKSGALPAKPNLVSEDSVAPTLGEESIRRGMMAIGVSLGLIVVFMCIYYGWSGVIANIALIVNLILLLGILSLFEATLTLPGIAGVVLTMGMAVDANILINERMREERERGLPLKEVVRIGYKHAFSAIFDGHVTAILTAIILYFVGTGPIRGFAVTLLIGVALSLFTAVWVTRAIVDWAIAHGHLKEVRYIRFLHGTNFPFIRKRVGLVIFSVVMLNAGFVLFMARGDDKYGIDFNGGSVVQMRLKTPLTADQVHDRLASYVETVGGKKVHPYEGIEVQALGEALPNGARKTFQLLLSSHGASEATSTASAEEIPAARAVGGGIAPEAETTTAVAATPQQQFVNDVERLFAEDLVPPAYETGAPEVVTGTAQVRLTLIVHLSPEALKDPERAKAADPEALRAALADRYPGVEVRREDDTLHVKTGPLDIVGGSTETQEAALRAAVEKQVAGVVSNPFPFRTTIGSAVAQNLKARAILAILLSLVMIIVYIAFRFELKAGFAASLCLFHDVLVALGFMMIFDMTRKWTGIDAKLNLTSIAAFLTIVGYSINDTIVTFDRMRENLLAEKPKDRAAYEAVLEKSINQTLARTILTAFTVFLVLIVLAFAGVPSLMGFTLALLAGVVFGTYSSISVATPILLVPARKLAAICAAQLAFFIAVGIATRYVHF